MFAFFNVLPIFIFVPFCATKISSTYGVLTGVVFIVGILSLAFLNNFLVLYLKRKAINNIAYFASGLALIATFGILDYYNIISIRTISAGLFGKIIFYPYLALVFPLLAWLMFRFNAAYLLKNLYTEELGLKDKKKVSTDYAFLNRFGKVGELAALELKLILRHKRSRGSVFMGFMFLLYGLIFYKEKLIINNEFGKMFFAAIFMTGITILTYGQFMFAWQSTHFDGLISNKIDLKNFIKAKFLLFNISCSIITILSSFYGFMSWKLLLLHLSAYLYNIGFGSVIVLYFATFNYKRLDITSSASFNWQGVGASQFILGIPFILFPLMIYVPFGYLDMPYIGLVVVGGFGLAMLLTRGYWINYLTKKLIAKKYKIAEGFRE
ncbi:MAG: hypothetical protein EOP53_14510 [Sphingobacteriales bacterium]|nr:MAG: hypothetical protein EOP53_14510 [Sphingobacteriales bacterium]